MDTLSQDKEVQRLAMEYFNKTDEGRKLLESLGPDKAPGGKAADFKSPEGFSNVIGVGPNPVLEAMAQQTEIALAQLAELQKISGSTPAGQGDFTKGTQSK